MWCSGLGVASEGVNTLSRALLRSWWPWGRARGCFVFKRAVQLFPMSLLCKINQHIQEDREPPVYSHQGREQEGAQGHGTSPPARACPCLPQVARPATAFGFSKWTSEHWAPGHLHFPVPGIRGDRSQATAWGVALRSWSSVGRQRLWCPRDFCGGLCSGEGLAISCDRQLVPPLPPGCGLTQQEVS